MVFPGDVESDSSSSSTEISAEDYAKAAAKNNVLNESLGFLENDNSEPAMEDNEEDDVLESSDCFSEMELEHIAHKNALVNQTIGCGGDDGPLVTEIQEQPETVKERKVKSQTEQFFTSSAMELDSDQVRGIQYYLGTHY